MRAVMLALAVMVCPACSSREPIIFRHGDCVTIFKTLDEAAFGDPGDNRSGKVIGFYRGASGSVDYQVRWIERKSTYDLEWTSSYPASRLIGGKCEDGKNGLLYRRSAS